jgi:hypothetical membrane protein
MKRMIGLVARYWFVVENPSKTEKAIRSLPSALAHGGPIIGMILPFLFGSMWIVAIMVNGNWILGEDTLSELGGQVSSRWIFNSAAIASGVMGAIFSTALYLRFRSEFLGRAGGAMMALASIFLTLVGVFPIDTGTPHSIASVAFFGLAALSAIMIEFPLRNAVGTGGIPSVVTIWILVVSFSALFLTPLPFAEAVATSGLLIWILTLSTWMRLGHLR